MMMIAYDKNSVTETECLQDWLWQLSNAGSFCKIFCNQKFTTTG
jgi:hypothetical protein